MSSPCVYVYGSTGRIGSILSNYLKKNRIPCVSKPTIADVIVLAVPHHAVEGLLKKHPKQKILDMSGFCKRSAIGVYGLHKWDPKERIVQNVGCFASSVIQGLLRSNILGADIDGAIQISTIGGASTAHREQVETLRLARRLWNHPHQQEIEKAIPNLRISHFVITLQTAIEHGIWTCIMGRLLRDRPSTERIDGNDILGRTQVPWSLQCQERNFVLTTALDNLHYPAFHAYTLIQSLGNT